MFFCFRVLHVTLLALTEIYDFCRDFTVKCIAYVTEISERFRLFRYSAYVTESRAATFARKMSFRLFAKKFGEAARNVITKTTPIEKPPVLPVRKPDEVLAGNLIVDQSVLLLTPTQGGGEIIRISLSGWTGCFS